MFKMFAIKSKEEKNSVTYSNTNLSNDECLDAQQHDINYEYNVRFFF